VLPVRRCWWGRSPPSRCRPPGRVRPRSPVLASAQLGGLTVTLRNTVDTETNSGAELCAGGVRAEAGESC
jgi:hypothetical protein